MSRLWKIIFSLILLLLIIPFAYLLYDRSLMPPLPKLPETTDTPKIPWEQYVGDYLAKDSTPNAARHYLNALSSYSSYFEGNSVKELNDVSNNGWKSNYPDLDKWLSLNQYSLDELLKGTEMKNCTFPPVDPVKNVRIPNFLAVQTLAKLMNVSGKKLESENQRREALQRYLAILQFGSDISQKNQTTISQIIGIAVIAIGTYPISNLISSDTLPESDYLKIIHELDGIDKQQATFQEIISWQYYNIQSKYIYDFGNPLKTAHGMHIATNVGEYVGKNFSNGTSFIEKDYDRFFGEIEKLHFNDITLAVYLFFNKGHINKNKLDFSRALYVASSTLTYQEFSKKEWAKSISKDSINYLDFRVDNYVSEYSRQMIVISKLRLTQLQSAIHLYHLQKQKYPEKLDDLKIYFTDIPKDPFSDKDFLWATDSSIPYPYSVGPDFKDNSAKLLYDPTNGTVSAGDIYWKN